MGKIHDALEKSSKAQELKLVAPRPVEATPASKEKKLKAPSRKADKSADKSSAGQPDIDANATSPEAAAITEPPPSTHPAHEGMLDSTLITYHDPNSVEAEIFKILRTNILFPKKGVPPRSIMVTSAIPGDGKSFVAANLSISIAQGIEEHVLLMDCDMRRPSIHRRFGIGDRVPGLSNYLVTKQKLSSLLKKTIVDKLTILPGGPQPPNPSELLSSQTMKDLLKETKERYKDRYIVVDSPPPQLTAETTALANYIDGIIVVVKYGSTPKDRVTELIERIGRDKVIGVVMNSYRVPTTERYGFGKYKKYQKE